ncbi:MAG: hypothetical protein IKP50_04775 [Bacilli bacterium]|nr:hypothetical protein [Bacilli bacterium]
MNKKTSLVILLSTLSLVFTSCSRGKKPEVRKNTNDPQIESGNIFDELDLGEGKELEDRSEFYSNQVYDVDPGYKVKLALKNPHSESGTRRARALRSAPQDIVTIKDNDGNVYNNLDVESVSEGGQDYFLVSPTGGTYEEGAICKTTISDPEGEICFADKDPEMEELYFNVKDTESNYRHVSSSVKFFDINKLMYAPVPDEEYPELTMEDMAGELGKYYFEHASFHFGYANDSFKILKEGDHFAVTKLASNGVPDINYQSIFYGKFVKHVKEDSSYRVTFTNADLTEIFKDDETGNVAYDIMQREEKAEMKNITIEATEEELLEQFTNNIEFRRFCGAVAIATKNKTRGVDYILSHINITPKFSYHDSTLDIQLKASGTIPVGESKKVAIKIVFTFQWSISLATSGGCKVKKFWGVPYKINAYGTVTKTTDFTFSLEIQVLFNLNPETPNDKSVSDQIKDAYKQLENDPAYFMPRLDEKTKITENHISQTLCSLDVPFGYVFDFRIGLSFELTIDLNVFFRYGYHSHEVETIVAFSTDNGIEETDNKVSNSSSVHTMELGGQLYIEVGLRITISVGLAGLSSLFSLGAYVEAGIYIKLGAMGGLSFGANQQTTCYGAFDADMGYYWSLTGFMDFLFMFHPRYEFLKKKKSFFGYSAPITIMDTFAEDLVLTKQITDIGQTKLLTVKQFDIPSFTVNIKTYKLDSIVESKGDKFHPLTITFDTQYNDCIYVDVESNLIIVTDDAPDYFKGKIKVHIDSRVDYFFNDDGSDDVVDFVYKRDNIHKVNFGENDKSEIYLQPGRAFTLVEPTYNSSLGDVTKFTNQRYVKNSTNTYYTAGFNFEYDPDRYRFINYTDGTNEYQPGDTYVMGDVDVTITANLYKWIYYNVTFYDCYGDVIKAYDVKEGSVCPEPTDEEIYREGYIFVGWDRYFNIINQNMEIYGIYIKGESSL